MAGSAVLDACVLYPITLCDTLLRLAESGLYLPRWSAAILDEVRRNLAEFLPPERVQRRLGQMQASFPDAQIGGYEHLIAQMENDPDDRHVLAAAVIGHVPLIVTDNVRDFPTSALAPLGVVAVTADRFLADLYDENPQHVLDVLEQQAASYRKPPVSLGELLTQLHPHSFSLVARLTADRL